MIKKMIFYIAGFISSLFPKNSKLVLFGAMSGRFYGDNSRHLFEWILENKLKMEPVWVTSSNKVYLELIRLGYPVAKIKSLRGIILLFRAKAAVFTNTLTDFAWHSDLVPECIKLISLRHGRSVKKVRFARESHAIDKNEATERQKESRLVQYVISTSEFISDLQEKCLLVGREKHIVTGYPRNDILFSVPESCRTTWKSFLNEKEYRKVILYGPSWRHGRESTKFFPFADFNKAALTNLLENENMLLLLRPHKNDLLKYKDLLDFLNGLCESPNIKMATHEIFPDVNSFLPFTDVLISDYSALYHDFLLLDRPLLFIPYDYEDFRHCNGFLYDYREFLPGPEIKSFSEFCSSISNIAKGRDTHAEQRRKLRSMVHFYQDANSCKRTAELVLKVIGKAQ